MTGRTETDKLFLAETAHCEKGGNGLVLMVHRSEAANDFVLKSNLRQKHTLTSTVLQGYVGQHTTIETDIPEPETLVVDGNGVALVLHNNTQYGLLAVDSYAIGHRPSRAQVRKLMQSATTATVVAGGAVFSRLVAETRMQIQCLPWVCTRQARQGAVYTVDTVGPAMLPAPEPLVVLTTKARPSVLEAINGPGILPNVVRTDGQGHRWLVMPLASGGTLGDMHCPGRTVVPVAEIFRTLSNAAITCLTQSPPQFFGDFKPENIVMNPVPGAACQVIDMDWVPTWADCVANGGPRHWATFQISKRSPVSADYEHTPTLMVLHSLLVTTAALAAPANLAWAYANAVHQCNTLPYTTYDAISAMPVTGYPLRASLLTLAKEVTGQLTVEKLIALLQTAVSSATTPSPQLKRKRVDEK